jgi:hypothetical protein
LPFDDLAQFVRWFPERFEFGVAGPTGGLANPLRRFQMNGRAFNWAVRAIAVLLLTLGTGAVAQNRTPERLSGLINDYTPSTIAGGPWEMRGKWSLRLHHESGTADFSAFLNMETSDYGFLDGNIDPTDPDTARTAHTHHITMTGATVSYDASDTSLCPAFKAPAPSPVFVVKNGTSTIAANGGPAPFAKNGPSQLQICVLGGSEVELSNITLQWTGAAAGHFGSQAVHGVVRNTSWRDEYNDRP